MPAFLVAISVRSDRNLWRWGEAMLYLDGEYVGHTWVWPSPRYVLGWSAFGPTWRRPGWWLRYAWWRNWRMRRQMATELVKLRAMLAFESAMLRSRRRRAQRRKRCATYTIRSRWSRSSPALALDAVNLDFRIRVFRPVDDLAEDSVIGGKPALTCDALVPAFHASA